MGSYLKDQFLAATVSPLTFELPLRSAKLPLGKPAKLEAKLSVDPDGPQGLPEITWFKDGLPIGSRHKKSFNPLDGSMALYIDNVSPVDSGVYAVTAEIENAQPASSSAPVDVVCMFHISKICLLSRHLLSRAQQLKKVFCAFPYGIREPSS